MAGIISGAVWRELKCAKCGKIFIPVSYHRFKTNGGKGGMKYYCCWTCYAHRKDKDAKDTEETRKKIINGE